MLVLRLSVSAAFYLIMLAGALTQHPHFRPSQVWHFRDAAATFKGFESLQTQLAFQLRIDYIKPITQPESENTTAS